MWKSMSITRLQVRAGNLQRGRNGVCDVLPVLDVLRGPVSAYPNSGATRVSASR
jgi:hypothetical protein